MTITVAFFDSVQEFQNYVDKSIIETKIQLGETYNTTEKIRKKYESSASQHSEGNAYTSKWHSRSSTKQKEVSGFKILVNPTPEYELKLIEESVASLQEKIDKFEKTKELYSALAKHDTKVAMVMNAGVPSGFMFFGQDI